MIKISEKRFTFLGYLSVLFYIIHSVSWIIKGVPANLLWTCHLASLFIGIAVIFRIPLLNSLSVLWLSIGNIIWTIYLTSGGDFEPTSTLTHWGGLIVGLIGVRKMGMQKYSTIWSLAVLLIIQQLSKFITPESENINLAFRVHETAEKTFSSYTIYFFFLALVSTSCFLVMELLCRKFLNPEKDEIK
jgi:hypothetical protein